MKQKSTVGVVVSLHAAVFAAGIGSANVPASLALGGVSVLVLAVSVFHELTPGGATA